MPNFDEISDAELGALVKQMVRNEGLEAKERAITQNSFAGWLDERGYELLADFVRYALPQIWEGIKSYIRALFTW